MMVAEHADKHGGGPSLPVRVAEVAVGTLQAEQGLAATESIYSIIGWEVLSEARVKLLLEQVADGISQAASGMRDHMKEADSFANIGARMLNSWDRGVLRSLLDEKRSWISLSAK